MKEIGENIKSIFNTGIKRVEHISDVYRLLVLYKYGGVYTGLGISTSEIRVIGIGDYEYR